MPLTVILAFRFRKKVCHTNWLASAACIIRVSHVSVVCLRLCGRTLSYADLSLISPGFHTEVSTKYIER